jgi:hypothetical protein
MNFDPDLLRNLIYRQNLKNYIQAKQTILKSKSINNFIYNGHVSNSQMKMLKPSNIPTFSLGLIVISN